MAGLIRKLATATAVAVAAFAGVALLAASATGSSATGSATGSGQPSAAYGSAGAGTRSIFAAAVRELAASRIDAQSMPPTPRGYVRLPAEVIPALAPALARGEIQTAPASSRDMSARVTLTLTLRRSRQAAFQRFLAAVNDPRSADYRRFLPQSELTARFGPSAASYDRLLTWLRRSGLSGVSGSPDRLTIEASGSRALVQRLLHVPIEDFAEGSGRFYANVADPALPAWAAHTVSDVAGLADLARPAHPPVAPSTSTVLANPLAAPGADAVEWLCDYKWLAPVGGAIGLYGAVDAAFLKTSFTLFGLATGGAELAGVAGGLLGGLCVGAYIGLGVHNFICWGSGFEGASHEVYNALNCGGGSGGAAAAQRRRTAGGARSTAAAAAQKIGLLEFDTFHQSDVDDWLALSGSAADPASLSEVPVNGGVASPGAGEDEVLLDADAAMFFDPAPGTRYVVYDAPPSTSWQTVFNAMLGDGDTIISNSWSACEDEVSQADADSIDSILAQAQASGVSVFNGTGDTGSTCLDGSPDTVGVPSDSPHATAVGAATASFNSDGTYAGDTWWGANPQPGDEGASGYGVSRYFPRPSYQDGLTSSPDRSVPDVVVDAEPADGLQLCQADNGGCPVSGSTGGTSLAAPLLAGLTGWLDAQRGSGLGNMNSVLYPLAGTGALRSPASMGSDFAHVGLGSIDYPQLQLALAENGTAAAVDADNSIVAAIPPLTTTAQAAGTIQVPADGTTQGVVYVDLLDADGDPVSGRTVTLTADAGSGPVISPASDVSDADGVVKFHVSDATVENVTFTAKDTTDAVTLGDQPAITFQAPSATGAAISAGPATVPDDGTTQATITVYLQNSLGRPATGKTVTLSQSGNATITPAGSTTPSDTTTTDANGDATFTATDINTEAVQFTAVDVSDEPAGSPLPVPGSASVTFSNAPPPSCSNAPTLASGYGLSTFASPFTYDPYTQYLPGNFTQGACAGVEPPAFDAGGSAYVADFYTGTLYVLPAGGGTPDMADQLPDASFGPNNISGLAFGKDGELYASLSYPPASGYENHGQPEIVQLDPTTGAILRVVASAPQLPDCPESPAVDPLTGDLFVAGGCSGYAYSGDITRIADPSSATPTVSTYANTGGIGDDGTPQGLTIAPDGTLYAIAGGTEIVGIAATSAPQPAQVTQLVQFTSDYGIGLAVTGSDDGAATQLTATDLSGYIYRIDLTQTPAAVATIATPAAAGGSFGYVAVGPDSCVYISAASEIDRFGSGACGSAGNVSSAPSLSLSSSGPSPAPTGTPVTFMAQLANFASAAGTPVEFVVTGANPQDKLVTADGAGSASFSYSATFAGHDTVQAFAVDGANGVSSAPLTQAWTVGVDVTVLSMGASQGGGPLGGSATLSAQLVDVSQSPPAPVAGASVSFSVAGQSCTATTDALGNATCAVTPAGPAGLDPVTASYAGSTAYAPSSASNAYQAASIGVATTTTTTTATATTATSTSTSSAASTTTTSSTATTHTTTTATTAVSPQHPVSLCGAVSVDLLDVYSQKGRVHLLGYASTTYAGKAVAIRSTWNRKIVARSTVRATGYFSATAPLPPARLRESNSARYEATVASKSSPSLKLSRRLYVFAITRIGGGKVRISGQVVKPLATPVAPIVVSLRQSCSRAYQPQKKAKVTLARATGDFEITTKAPPSDAPGAVYLLKTKVAASPHSSSSFTTYSLPRVVGG